MLFLLVHVSSEVKALKILSSWANDLAAIGNLLFRNLFNSQNQSVGNTSTRLFWHRHGEWISLMPNTATFFTKKQQDQCMHQSVLRSVQEKNGCCRRTMIVKRPKSKNLCAKAISWVSRFPRYDNATFWQSSLVPNRRGWLVFVLGLCVCAFWYSQNSRAQLRTTWALSLEESFGELALLKSRTIPHRNLLLWHFLTGNMGICNAKVRYIFCCFPLKYWSKIKL